MSKRLYDKKAKIFNTELINVYTNVICVTSMIVLICEPQIDANFLDSYATLIFDPICCLDLISKLAEYAAPKLARTELVGDDKAPIKHVIAWDE